MTQGTPRSDLPPRYAWDDKLVVGTLLLALVLAFGASVASAAFVAPCVPLGRPLVCAMPERGE